MPRPTRLRAVRFCAGFRVERLSSSSGAATSVLLDADEVADFSQHTEGLRSVLALDRAADLAQAQRPESAPVLLGLADLATRLRDRQLRHLEWSRWSRSAAEPPRAPRSSCVGTGLHGRPCPGSERLPRDGAGSAARSPSP